MNDLSKLTPAEQIHRGTFAEMHVEEVVDELWPDLVGHIGTDHYDNSLELYFTAQAPADLSCTLAQAKVVCGLGFHRFWLNFTDGTEQYCREGAIEQRARTSMPRGGSKSTLRPRLQCRVESLEKAVESMGSTVSLIGAALNGDLGRHDDYPGKPIAVVEKAIETRARIG